MNYKASMKRNDKWVNFGRIKVNQYGKLQLSFKNTPEFKEMVNGGGEWLNFALFEDKPKEETPQPAPPARYIPDDSEIPF